MHFTSTNVFSTQNWTSLEINNLCKEWYFRCERFFNIYRSWFMRRLMSANVVNFKNWFRLTLTNWSQIWHWTRR